MTFHDYKMNKQAIKDLAEGKQTDAVKEFLKRYEIRPRENKEGTKCEQTRRDNNGKKKKRNRRSPCNRVRYSRRHSSNRKHSSNRRSSKARATATMRTWSTGRSWKRSESQRLRWNSRDSLIPC